MIYDFNSYDKKLSSEYYDICICGAGAAGVTLAKTLAEKGKKVVLLEGGDEKYTQQSQDCYKGESVGMPYYLDSFRLRFLGGTTNHWSGRCRPFVKEDFFPKVINGLPGWPIEHVELERYLPGAKKILGLPEENTFKPIPGTIRFESQVFEPDESIVSEKPVRFGEKYAELLSESTNIDLFINANTTEILLENDSETVGKVIVKTFSGKEDSVLADKYILCMGAIENARILLNSNKQVEEGIGNKTDMVGRCFMEHFNVEMGSFIAEQGKWKNNLRMEYFTKPSYIRENKLGMANVTFYITTKLKAYGRTKDIKKLFNRLSCEMGVSDKLQFIYKHDCLGDGKISSLCEQFPNKESRITLGKEQDELGIPRVILDWKMSEADERSIRHIVLEIAKEFAKNNLGRVKLASYILDKESSIPTNIHSHQMGTTRMAARPEEGVVDSNCRVFDTKNLYIAGSSVFSTGGGGNPTMPIVQLALRLAEHL